MSAWMCAGVGSDFTAIAARSPFKASGLLRVARASESWFFGLKVILDGLKSRVGVEARMPTLPFRNDGSNTVQRRCRLRAGASPCKLHTQRCKPYVCLPPPLGRELRRNVSANGEGLSPMHHVLIKNLLSAAIGE